MHSVNLATFYNVLCIARAYTHGGVVPMGLIFALYSAKVGSYDTLLTTVAICNNEILFIQNNVNEWGKEASNICSLFLYIMNVDQALKIQQHTFNIICVI